MFRILFIMVIGIGAIICSIVVYRIEYRACKKREKLKTARDIVLTNSSKWKNGEIVPLQTLSESLLFSGSIGALTLIDMYHTLDHSDQYLKLLMNRFPNEVGDYGALDWFSKVETLYANGAESVQGYVSNLKGSMAEQLAMDYFEAQGYDVSMFAQLNHPNNDLTVKIGNEVYEYSVKCGSVSYIKNAIDAHPDSYRYVINSEAFEEMYNEGLIVDYANRGIEIIDGGYLDVELSDLSSEVFNEIHESVNAESFIPYVSLGFLGYRVVKEIKSYQLGARSEKELGINVLMDATRIGAVGGAATVLSQIGGSIGTFILPGIGTLIGGVTGVLIASFTTSFIFNAIKMKWKWGKIIQILDELGQSFMSTIPSELTQYFDDHLISLEELRNKCYCEANRLIQHAGALDPYSEVPVTIEAVLSEQSYKVKRITYERYEKAISSFSNYLRYTFEDISIKKSKRKYASCYLGSVIISDQAIGKYLKSNKHYASLFSEYERENNKAPNCPFKLKLDQEHVFLSLFKEHYLRTFYELDEPFDFRPIINWGIIAVSSVIGVWFIGYGVQLSFLYLNN